MTGKRDLCDWQPVVILIALLFAARAEICAGQDGPIDFDRQVAPLISHRCLGCHSGVEAKGKLRLDTVDGLKSGSESGPVVAAGDPGQSLLWDAVSSDSMPPKKPLSDSEKALLKRWIEDGANWGTSPIDPHRFTTDGQAGLDWWSLQPLRTVAPPTADPWCRNPIDAFVLEAMRQNHLSPSGEADRPTLIRRLYFDLLGLPPTADEVKAFVQDGSPDAWEQLVDRTLASGHYGERWARHWLDVVRFGESNGFEYDEPRDNAWPYRNWVIDSLNADMPYDEFVRQQLAGDVMDPGSVSSGAAAGFLVAGAHNTTLPSSDKMRMAMAQDEMEDLIATVSQTFLGLTANCARCHEHKFDPVSQKDYYQLAAALSGVSHGIREFPRERTEADLARLQQVRNDLQALNKQRSDLETPVREVLLKNRKAVAAPVTVPQAYAEWEFENNELLKEGFSRIQLNGNARLQDGALVLDGVDSYAETGLLPEEISAKTLEAWVQLASEEQAGGGVVSLQTPDGAVFDAIVYGEREPRRWMAGSNGFVRTAPFQAVDETDATKRFVHVAIVYGADGSITGYREGLPYGQSYRPGELQRFESQKSQLIFGLRHMPTGGNRMLSGRIDRARFYDRALTADEIAASAFVAGSQSIPEPLLLAAMNSEQRDAYEGVLQRLKGLNQEVDELSRIESQKMYTCVSIAVPAPTRVLRRGDVTLPDEAVMPGGLRAIAGTNPDFGLSVNAPDADRRTRLAQWITDRNNSLFHRVIVNRVWHYHFGQGIVSTPNDFGFNGARPSHPDLLEWLASEFRNGNLQLKALHRLIVTSATYRQSADLRPDMMAIDAENRYLWRRAPQRLEAEALRDAVLVITNQLDRTIGGRGYRDVNHFKFKGSNFYEPLAENGSTRRRTIYRFSPRGGRNPLLDTFDCPDPSATSPRRATTTTPLQALSLLNNDLVFRMADQLAERLRTERATIDEQVALGFELAWGRSVAASDFERGVDFVNTHGLPAFCRVLINTNEFLYVR